MTTPQQIAAELLCQNGPLLADQVFVRLHEHPPTTARTLTRQEWNQCRDRVQDHLLTLAACLNFACPRLLADYLHWSQNLAAENAPLTGEIQHVYRTLEEATLHYFPKEAAQALLEYLRWAYQENAKTSPPEQEIPPPPSALQTQYLGHVLEADRAAALRLLLESLQAGTSMEQIYLEILQPSQRQIGRMWQRGEITVAQEHYCTAATQFVMSQLQPYFLRNEPSEKTLLATCVGEELHEVGLRIVTDLFELDGWHTVYLGANTPAEGVVHSIKKHRVDVLAASTTMTRHLFRLADLIAAVRNDPECQHVKILVGGYPFNLEPFLWQRLGADASAFDAHDALALANHFSLQPAQTSLPVHEPLESPSSSATPTAQPDDLSRLNNELITVQRRLHQANVQLQRLNAENEAKAKALAETDRQKDEFLAMLGHELRGPLDPINHALALLRMPQATPDQSAQAHDTIQRQVEQLARLTSDLLDVSRIAHGKIELITQQVNLNDIAQRAIEIARPHLEAKSHEFTFTSSQEPLLLEADEIRLTQVLANLLTNAAKYTEPGGTIQLTTHARGDHVLIEVRDNGTGIEADLLPHIFTTFTQEQRSRVHSQGGLGLGLSLVRLLVELHDGEVSAHSPGPGQGSTFTVQLPRLVPATPPAAESPTAEPPTAAQAEPSPPRRILIVDDSRGVAEMLASLLELQGHETAIARDGHTALRKFDEFVPEIVILDLMLPDRSGLELVRELREKQRDPAPLFVALTGHDDSQHRQQAAEAGFETYLVKPIGLAEIESVTLHPKLQSAETT